jgi:hypothetical protein
MTDCDGHDNSLKGGIYSDEKAKQDAGQLPKEAVAGGLSLTANPFLVIVRRFRKNVSCCEL